MAVLHPKQVSASDRRDQEVAIADAAVVEATVVLPNAIAEEDGRGVAVLPDATESAATVLHLRDHEDVIEKIATAEVLRHHRAITTTLATIATRRRIPMTIVTGMDLIPGARLIPGVDLILRMVDHRRRIPTIAARLLVEEEDLLHRAVLLPEVVAVEMPMDAVNAVAVTKDLPVSVCWCEIWRPTLSRKTCKWPLEGLVKSGMFTFRVTFIPSSPRDLPLSSTPLLKWLGRPVTK
jgi:hypothetical protein